MDPVSELKIIARIRSDFPSKFGIPRQSGLVEELSAGSPLFARGWRRQAVLAREGGVRTFHDAAGGMRAYAQHSFAAADGPGHKLVLLIPAD